jgi:hypothetical protein
MRPEVLELLRRGKRKNTAMIHCILKDVTLHMLFLSKINAPVLEQEVIFLYMEFKEIPHSTLVRENDWDSG